MAVAGKVTLVFPRLLRESNVWAPLPLQAVAAPLLDAGFEVELIDGRVVELHLPRIIEAAAASLYVGLSVMTGYQIKDAVRVTRAIKEARPDVPVVWGGYHASMLPEQTLADPGIDMVIRGQGQIGATELALRLAGGSVAGLGAGGGAGEGAGGGDLNGVPGLCYKIDGEIVVGAHPELVDLGQFPATPYGIIDIEKYMVNDLDTRTMKYFSSQGCPYGCGFCAETSMYSRGWTGFPVGRILDDLEELADRHGVNAIDFADTNFFISKKKVRDFCEGMIERGIALKWAADIRTRQFLDFEPELRQLIYDAGCRRLLLGAESGSQAALEHIGKRTTVAETLEVSRVCNELGIIARFTTMFGFPAEPEKDIEATLKMIEGIKAVNRDFEVHGFFFAPYPGASMYSEAIREGFSPPQSLEGWSDFDLTGLHTPWVERGYKEKVDMIIGFYMPFASPGPELRQKMSSAGIKGACYRSLHRLALKRVGRRNFSLPVEWWLKKMRSRRA